MPWTTVDVTTGGKFLAWLENSEGAKDRRLLVAVYMGVAYLAGHPVSAGRGSYQTLHEKKYPVNSAQERGALLAEIVMQAFAGGNRIYGSANNLPLTENMCNIILNDVLPNSPQGAFVKNTRTAENFLAAALKASHNGVALNAVRQELYNFTNGMNDTIQRWFDTFQEMEGETPNTVAVRSLTSLRSHQKMKLIGGSFGRGKHTAGNFSLLSRAVDGKPVLLISSNVGKEVKTKYTQVMTGNRSVVGRVIVGTFTSNPDTRTFNFTVTGYGNTSDQTWWTQQSLTKKQTYFDHAIKATGAYRDDLMLTITVA